MHPHPHPYSTIRLIISVLLTGICKIVLYKTRNISKLNGCLTWWVLFWMIMKLWRQRAVDWAVVGVGELMILYRGWPKSGISCTFQVIVLIISLKCAVLRPLIFKAHCQLAPSTATGNGRPCSALQPLGNLAKRHMYQFPTLATVALNSPRQLSSTQDETPACRQGNTRRD